MGYTTTVSDTDPGPILTVINRDNVYYLAETDLLIAELVPSDARDERGWVTTEYVQLFKEAVLVGNER